MAELRVCIAKQENDGYIVDLKTRRSSVRIKTGKASKKAIFF
ncbi:unnamed protein product [Larinioides sclopetarius]|uniref:Uncharacterized protein n=1 Tax=Larinioides sclopetarius TaxID=280406 RepID=A0AAV2BQR2_9ARAC